jgi:hypothetical protein
VSWRKTAGRFEDLGWGTRHGTEGVALAWISVLEGAPFKLRLSGVFLLGAYQTRANRILRERMLDELRRA